MAVFKQFNTNQVVVAPFNANKRFAYSGYEVTASDVGIEYYQTVQGPYTSGSYPSGFTTVTDGVLVFNSIKQLYYSNYLTSSTGDEVSTSSLFPGASEAYNQQVGIITGPRYENYLQTSLSQSRYFSQFPNDQSGNTLGPSVISIPSKLFGEQIPPTCFQFEYTSSQNFTRSLVTDDGEGNLMVTYNSGEARPGVSDPTLQEKVGDIFYSQGIAVFTGPDSGSLSDFPKQMGLTGIFNNNVYSSSIQFSSSIQIRENQYKCVVRDNEYSYTTNPSALRPLGELNKTPNQLSGSIELSNYNDAGSPGVYEIDLAPTTAQPGTGGSVNVTIASDGTVSDITVVKTGKGYVPNTPTGINLSSTGGVGVISFQLTLADVTNLGTENTNETYYDFATGSYFSPYVTTIGLYNESYQLVAVGKLSQPIPISLYVDTTFVVNFDTW